MTIRCAKCGVELRGQKKQFQKYARAQGWTFFDVPRTATESDRYYRCGQCGPHRVWKPDADGNR